MENSNQSRCEITNLDSLDKSVHECITRHPTGSECSHSNCFQTENSLLRHRKTVTRDNLTAPAGDYHGHCVSQCENQTRLEGDSLDHIDIRVGDSAKSQAQDRNKVDCKGMRSVECPSESGHESQPLVHGITQTESSSKPTSEGSNHNVHENAGLLTVKNGHSINRDEATRFIIDDFDQPRSVQAEVDQKYKPCQWTAESDGIITDVGFVSTSKLDESVVDVAQPHVKLREDKGNEGDKPSIDYSSPGENIIGNSCKVPSLQTQSSEYSEKQDGFTNYLWSELSRGYEPDENEVVYNVKRERVYAFLCNPQECEKFIFYGFLQCVDSFLFIFTFLPLRLMIIVLKLLARPWTLFMPHWYLSASQKCDLIKGIIICAGSLMMHQLIDASMVYHMIRGQAIIKLYIIFNLLDIGDRLLSSFGQDILDALMWTVADPKKRGRGVFSHLVVAVIYVFLHSILVLLQASALNVAFNSHNKALLTILISNNAVELKGSVFKKFEKTNLFQLACSDVRERFHFHVLIVIVCLRNMADFNWDIGKFIELIPDIITLMVCEVLVDQTKHAFVTKFNNIPSTVYREYTALLANDVITSRKKNAFSDVSDQVSRRLGLIPLPLACLLIKITMQCFKISTSLALLNAFLGFICLLLAKLVIGVVVYGWAIDYYRDYHQQQAKLSKRQRHKSGIDEALLKCENNYHWHRPKPTPAAATDGADGGRRTETLTVP